MANNFRSSYHQEQELTTNITSYWGYSLGSEPIDPKATGRQRSKPILANIHAISMREEPPKTERIAQLEEEIKAIKNDRIVDKMKEEALKAEEAGVEVETVSPVMKKMQKRVQEYNFLLEHKHLTEEAN